jgi:hypothetical protein
MAGKIASHGKIVLGHQLGGNKKSSGIPGVFESCGFAQFGGQSIAVYQLRKQLGHSVEKAAVAFGRKNTTNYCESALCPSSRGPE